MQPKIHQIFAENSLRNFNYIVESKNGFVIIDPYDAKQVTAALGSNPKVIALINTHEHHDHIRGNKELKERFGCQVLVHKNALRVVPEADRELSSNEIIDLGAGWNLEAIDTPGHTFSHLCLLLKNEDKVKAVFSGDTMFNAGVGNCHNGGDPSVLFETIRDYFKTLDDEVVLYPGHDYLRNNLGFTLNREPTNLEAKRWQEKHLLVDQNKEFLQTKMKDERLINTFLRLDQPSVIDNLPNHVQDEKAVFITLRELRNKW